MPKKTLLDAKSAALYLKKFAYIQHLRQRALTVLLKLDKKAGIQKYKILKKKFMEIR